MEKCGADKIGPFLQDKGVQKLKSSKKMVKFFLVIQYFYKNQINFKKIKSIFDTVKRSRKFEFSNFCHFCFPQFQKISFKVRTFREAYKI